MEKFYPEIEALKLDIEQKVGRRLATPSDFSMLTGLIFRETGCNVGLTTVKRLWGYIDNNSRMRCAILSIFTQFVGYSSWDDFCEAVHSGKGIESSFLTGRQVAAADLAEGALVEIRWLPDRYCLLRNTGGDSFVVEKALNCKLQIGDTFRASLFSIGHPLYVTDLVQDGNRYASYVAGTKHGLTLVRVKFYSR